MSALALAVQGLVLLLLVALSAFFSCSESALFSLNAIQVQRLRERDPKGGARVAAMLRAPPRVLSTLLVGNTLVNVAIASLGYEIIDTLLPAYSEVVAIPCMTLMLLVMGEVTPKRIALAYTERLVAPLSAFLAFWIRVLAPLRLLLEAASRSVGLSRRPERRMLSGKELLTAVELGAEQGALADEERSMVDGIMRLSDMQARNVMTPRVDLVGIDLDDPPERQREKARATPFHYLPVYRGTPDAIEGMLDVPRYLLDPSHDLRHAIAPAHFVPETASLDELLITFLRSGRHVACVLDEYGGTAGLIARDDILRLVTGEMRTDATRERATIAPAGDGAWLVDGVARLDEVNRETGLNLDAEGADRLAGWMMVHAGRLLQPGEAVEAQGCRAEVRQLNRHRIAQVLLARQAAPGPEVASADGAGAEMEAAR
jgi:CBS domain containing-hemolysin-like protein